MIERFKIVFDKLEEAVEREAAEQAHAAALFAAPDSEIDEIRELCRLSTLVSEPDPVYFTGT